MTIPEQLFVLAVASLLSGLIGNYIGGRGKVSKQQLDEKLDEFDKRCMHYRTSFNDLTRQRDETLQHGQNDLKAMLTEHFAILQASINGHNEANKDSFRRVYERIEALEQGFSRLEGRLNGHHRSQT